MAKVQVEMEAAWGSIYVDCSVLDKRDGKYLVELINGFEGKITQWVDKNRLRFPKYAEYMIC